MNRTFFSKTLLAVVVSAAAAPVGATQYDLGQGFKDWSGATVTDGLTLTGQRKPADSNDRTGVTLFQTAIQGGFINRGDFLFDTPEAVVTAIGMDAGFHPGFPSGGTVQGDFINEGRIVLANVRNAEGIEIGNTHITGSFINSGTVSISMAPDLEFPGSPEGIYLHRTTLDGDLVNSGVIDVQGRDTVGLILDSGQVNIGGRVLNSGTVKATGEEAQAFHVETGTSALRIENTGSIISVGKNSQAVSWLDGSIDSFLNSKLVQASGDGATAILLSGADFTHTSAAGNRDIINTGTIVSDGVAIRVGSDQVAHFEINQRSGLIRSNQGSAIDGGGLARLNWTGGSIVGDLLNMEAVDVSGPASFTGSKIGSTVSVSSGSLDLQAPGTRITGDLNVASGAGVGMALSDRVVPGTPYLTVAGNAAFASGSRVILNANPGDFASSSTGTHYTLVKAGTLQDNGLSVGSSSALLNVSSFSSDVQTVSAVVNVKSDAQVASELGNAGASRSTLAAVNQFKNGPLSRLDSNDAVYKAFAGAASQEQLARLGERLAPEVNRGAIDAASSGQAITNNVISSRVGGLRSGLSSGDTPLSTGVWIQGLTSELNQDTRDGIAGYSADSDGVAVGADTQLDSSTTLGLAYSNLNTRVASDTGNKTQVLGNTLSLYGSWGLDNWFVDGNLSYGRNDNDSKRYIADSTAKGSYHSDVWALSALGGYSFRLSEQVLLEPRVAARYSNIRIDSYDEHGSSAALHNNAQRFEVGELGAGLRLAANLPLA
ncbi:autotransporter outer membrane beta-barrel domain-containing protein, partial [Pseudomonas asplenii]|uniref:autotransporter family protein n=1 Tax=Pseudomonas asplenii TaxID=53407 RepID=UPI0003774D74